MPRRVRGLVALEDVGVLEEARELLRRRSHPHLPPLWRVEIEGEHTSGREEGAAVRVEGGGEEGLRRAEVSRVEEDGVECTC